jgi:hypothetical protein
MPTTMPLLQWVHDGVLRGPGIEAADGSGVTGFNLINYKPMGFWKKVRHAVDPRIGATVVRFTTHGCMGQVHELSYIGTLVDTGTMPNCGNLKFYRVKVHADGRSNEARNGVDLPDEWVAHHYLQAIGPRLYFAYD